MLQIIVLGFFFSQALGQDTSTMFPESTTGGMESTTGGMESTTGGMESTTGGMESTTGGMESTTGGMESTTGGMMSTTGGMESTTWGMMSTTGGMESTTWGMMSTTGGMESTTWGMMSTTGGMESTTGGMTSTMMETTARPTTCEDFKDGACPLTEANIISNDEVTDSPGMCQYHCIESALTGGECKFFTQFETTCYLLRSCDEIANIPGCVSGPNLPDYDSCVETTSAPETTTAAETTIGTETSPETAGTTTMEMTTGGADCSGFYPGFVCTPEVSAIDTITHIMTPKECQTLCQLRGGCSYWSHWIEVREEHIGHCDLHFSCPYLEDELCLSDADPKCPTIPMSIYGDADDMNNAAEEVDAPQDKKSMPPGPGSGECGCISGPAYPSIDECDFW